MRMIVLVLWFSFSLIPLSHSDIASWVDKNGTRHYSNTEHPEGSDNIKITREHASGPQPVNPVPEKKRPPDRKKMAVSPSGGVEFSSRGDGNDNKHNTSEKIRPSQKNADKIAVHTQKELCEKAKQRLKEAQNALRTYPFLDERKSRENKKVNEQMKEYLKYNIRARHWEMRQICAN